MIEDDDIKNERPEPLCVPGTFHPVSSLASSGARDQSTYKLFQNKEQFLFQDTQYYKFEG